MKAALFLGCAALLAFAVSSCREGIRCTILFSGDERGGLLPVG